MDQICVLTDNRLTLPVVEGKEVYSGDFEL